ncbi:MAG: hypothetical protein LBT60_00565, partial [Oscillospiraceae bacterium]|nr:hypothetical protein [Oscillospiraceae bacterium]
MRDENQFPYQPYTPYEETPAAEDGYRARETGTHTDYETPAAPDSWATAEPLAAAPPMADTRIEERAALKPPGADVPSG